MADIFLSYKNEEQAIARKVADDLEAEGFSVFFDVHIEVGGRWDVEIEREIKRARAVVVLWSALARESEWVRREAREGLKRGILCPAVIEACEAPLEFSDVQTANLIGRRHGDHSHPEWRRLISAVERCVGKTARGAPRVQVVDAPSVAAISSAGETALLPPLEFTSRPAAGSSKWPSVAGVQGEGIESLWDRLLSGADNDRPKLTGRFRLGWLAIIVLTVLLFVLPGEVSTSSITEMILGCGAAAAYTTIASGTGRIFVFSDIVMGGAGSPFIPCLLVSNLIVAVLQYAMLGFASNRPSAAVFETVFRLLFGGIPIYVALFASAFGIIWGRWIGTELGWLKIAVAILMLIALSITIVAMLPSIFVKG